MNEREAWDRLYLADGRPWKGEPDERLPLEGAVLELGVGNGKGLLALPPSASPIGLDFSRPALLSCRKWKRIPLIQGDVTALPFRDSCFSGISASHILGHLSEEGRRRAALEMVRVLAEGGLLYVSVFGEGDMRCGAGRELEERTFARGNGISCHYFTEDEVASIFPGLIPVRSWERNLTKRYHGQPEIRQERRAIFRK